MLKQLTNVPFSSINMAACIMSQKYQTNDIKAYANDDPAIGAYMAVLYNDIDLLAHFLSKDSNINIRTLIFRAIDFDYEKVVEYLYNYGIDTTTLTPTSTSTRVSANNILQYSMRLGKVNCINMASNLGATCASNDSNHSNNLC